MVVERTFACSLPLYSKGPLLPISSSSDVEWLVKSLILNKLLNAEGTLSTSLSLSLCRSHFPQMTLHFWFLIIIPSILLFSESLVLRHVVNH